MVKMIAIILAILVFLTVYLSVHLYLTFVVYLPKAPAVSAALVFFLAMQLIWGNYLMQRGLGWNVPKEMFTAGFFIGVFALILLGCYMGSDVLKLLDVYPKRLKDAPGFELGLFSVLSLIVVIGGYFGTVFTKVTELEFVSNKVKKDVRIVFLSDMHVGSADLSPEKCEKWIGKINAFQPDLVLIGGDILDGSHKPFEKEGYAGIFKKLKAKEGVFTVLGNHEYYGEGIPEAVETIEAAGITVLRDEVHAIPGLNIALIGRDDTLMGGMGGKHVRETQRLSTLFKKVSKGDYTIVMSHNPARFDEAVEQGADLQLSGHTHAGQLFPATLIVKFVYEKPYGLLKKGKSALYTTSGFGSWGPPIRILTRSEIVFVRIKRK